MERTLMILDVSRKQDYISGSWQLNEIVTRFADIDFVTSSSFFQQVAGEFYNEKDNLVSVGSGYTILQFNNFDIAKKTACRITEAVIRQFNGLELFVKLMPYESSKSPGDNLEELIKAMGRKKAVQHASFRRMNFGVELMDAKIHQPQSKQIIEYPQYFQQFKGIDFPLYVQELAEQDSFIAVVYINSNAMGKRIKNICKAQENSDWDTCRKNLTQFSKNIQQDFESVFQTVVDKVIQQKFPQKKLPICPIHLSGDHVCFVTAGSIGLECAKEFLTQLSLIEKTADNQKYSACAGVAIVRLKSSFHQAYHLAKQLCNDSAQKFSFEQDPDGGVSAMDWHIEFGQLKTDLNSLRDDYKTDEGGRLELRPITVVSQKPVNENEDVRTYNFFRNLCHKMQGETGRGLRSKIKDLRTAFKEGETATDYFTNLQGLQPLLECIFTSEFQTGETQMKQNVFRQIGDQKRCLLFDAIEIADHCTFFEEENS